MANPIKFTVPKGSSSSSSQTYDFPQGFAGGMNISVAPDQITPNQSPDMSDCDYSDGAVPTKRYGFDRAFGTNLGPGGIRIMAEFAKLNLSTEFLFIHNGNLYKSNE